MNVEEVQEAIRRKQERDDARQVRQEPPAKTPDSPVWLADVDPVAP